MDLVIVESPTKAKALRGFLGRGYRVVASMGHIRDLPSKQLGVDVERDFRPTYHLRKGGRKTLKQLREAAAKTAAIYLATDPDREGEAIAWHVLQALQVAQDRPIHRITFHEITSDAVRAALAKPASLDMDLVNAQQARRVLDRLVGYQVSPVLWKAIRGRRGLSAGRVQTVALRLVVEREREIEAFVREEYWTLEAEFSKVDDDRRFRARLVQVGRSKKDKPELKTEADAQAIIQALEGADYRVLTVKRRRQSRRPYPPYTTSTLQQDAANRLHWGADKTMRVAQQLYEGVALPDEGTVGLITYMRTDSTHVAEPAQAEAREVIARFWGDEYLPDKPPTYKTRAKVAQEAHEAIRPTSSWRTPKSLREYLSPDQAQLYELVWRRFIASQMKPAVYDVTTVDIASARDGRDLPYLFRATGRELLFAGFLKAYEVPDTAPSEEEGVAGQILPPLSDGEPLVLHGLFPEQHFTKPPPHFTEASLIKELERLGIGRPSTYAGIIRTLVTRTYVERQHKSLLATPLGFVVCDFLVEQFPDLFTVEFTAHMEEDLDRIARGERPWTTVLHEFYSPFAMAVEQAQAAAQAKPMTAPRNEKGAAPIGETCPECGGGVVVREGQYGRFRACANFPRCKWSGPWVVGQCPSCGADLVERKGKRGLFWGCSRYPDCRFTQEPQQQEL
ncbi:MAG TPA: type I DNA topoisomerase [Chloroflexi bacterium]|nr:type I DNA topoisomerase [Chloroflexota bacterium]